mmetsp:Transcript_4600/g.11817  ORF Transcript_4600/g.11817 Transcript_4600/m.11817 type:complete len:401 (+) Transcript_4600:254-1456(+)
MPLISPKLALQRGAGCAQSLPSQAVSRRNAVSSSSTRAAPRPMWAAAAYVGAGGWEGRTQPTVGWQNGNGGQSNSDLQADYQRRWNQAMQENQRRQQTRGSLQSWETAPTHQHAQSWDHNAAGWDHQQQHDHSDSHPDTSSSHGPSPLEDIGGGEGAGCLSVVEFKIKYATSFGQSLKIVGSEGTLGGWDVAHAPVMSWTEGNVWRAAVELSQSSVVEYKYVLVEEHGADTWQHGNNNVLAIKVNQSRLEVTDNWDGGQGTVLVYDGASNDTVPVSREAQLLSRTNEIEAMMATTRHQVRQWRVELDSAKEEVKVARMEVAHVASELQVEKQTSKRQALEIKLLKEENYELKTKLTESNAGFKNALETARMLLAQIEESGGTLPPLPDMPMPQVAERASA